MNDRRRMKQKAPGSSPAARRLWRPWALISLVLCLGLSLVQASPGLTSPALAEGQPLLATTITIVPTPATAQGCGTVYVDVWVNDVVDLYAADFRISFDPARLEVVDADPGTPGVQIQLLNGFLKPDFPVKRDADNTAGTIWYAVTQLNPTPPANGSGALARITFRAKATGLASASLHFTYTKLAELGGIQIPATAVDGSVDTVPQAGPKLFIARLNSTTARLTWTASPGVAQYYLYRDATPYFTPTAPPYQITTGLSYDDVGALGDPDVNHYYVVRSACANGFESDNSNRVGEFDFALLRDATNNVALPLIDNTLATADDLGAATGAMVVSSWVASLQGFDSRIVGLVGNNFALNTGQGYFVYTPGSGPTVFTTAGGVPEPGSISFSIVRGAVGDCQLNLISLPLDQSGITTADGLATAIGGVPVISQWIAAAGGFDSRIVGLIGNNFVTRIGYPYWPCADTSGGGPTWP